VNRPAAGREPAGSDDVVLGIDAGGSRTRARATRHGKVIYEGAGGPGNPFTTDLETLHASYLAALGGCPLPARVAACVSGAGRESRRAQITALLTDRFPGADVLVVPDYVAAFLAAPAGTDVCVVAGTGSVVCSEAADGTYPVSGGQGWILGDHGSATRLGRAALEQFVADPASANPSFTVAVEREFGASDWRLVVSAVSSARNPAPLLARAAPLLTAAAESSVPWAVDCLDAEMTTLAATAAGHIERHLSGAAELSVALSGGVWSSPLARSALIAALAQRCRCPVRVTRSSRDPVEGAVRLAARMRP
jgi:N-acetylglucosamine kinase-like BadF-type ATPase